MRVRWNVATAVLFAFMACVRLWERDFYDFIDCVVISALSIQVAILRAEAGERI